MASDFDFASRKNQSFLSDISFNKIFVQYFTYQLSTIKSWHLTYSGFFSKIANQMFKIQLILQNSIM